MSSTTQQREWNAEAPQAEFLQHDDVDEALYGGARRGGKSDALLIFSIVRRQEHPGSIRQGILTPTTRTMLEAAEQRVARLEAEIQHWHRRPQTVTSLASSVERYLEDLRATLGKNTDQARRLLARGLDRIVLRQESEQLVAEVRGNLAGLLRVEDTQFDSVGAGRGILFERHARIPVASAGNKGEQPFHIN